MIAYFDCFSGISGDMILGALVDAGLSPEKLRKKLSLLPVRGYSLEAKKVKRTGIRATKVNVVIRENKKRTEKRKFNDIKKIISGSRLSTSVKQKGMSVFKRLFEAEAKVHGSRYTGIHLHELGAIDCLVDIFGALIGLEYLGIEKVYASSLNLGSGTVKTEHGVLPVPAPATIELLKKIPVYSSDLQFELTTPTGAVLISALASHFGPMPHMQVIKTGTGAGGKNFQGHANILRMFLGEMTNEEKQQTNSDKDNAEYIVVIETNIDDMNPQVYEYVTERLFKEGAIDVYLTQVIMKKGRPGVKLTVLCEEERKEKLFDIILGETTSIGLRFYSAERKILKRKIKTVKTRYGKVNLKVSRIDSRRQKTSLEYDDCKKIAKKFDIPLLEVFNTIK